MSPIDGEMSGIKGKRRVDRPGRFDPSEPLHMTTRRAAKKETVNGSPSVNGSAENTESRRASLDDLRPNTSYSNESEVSTKSRRFSNISVTDVTHDDHMNGLPSSEEKRSSGKESTPLFPVEPTPSPSRKRKRSSSTPSHPAMPLLFNSIPDFGFESYDNIPQYEDDIDAVEVIQPEDLSDREVPPSQASSQSGERDRGNDVMVGQSIDVTPAVSGPVSPVTSESNSQEESPLSKNLHDALDEFARAAREQQDDPDQQDEQDEQDDVVDVGEEIDDVDDVDEQVRSDEDGRPRRRRFGGRRRAKHPIPKVEKAMVRQAELKSTYRAIARAQKAILAEIAQRTIDDLETSPELHVQEMEYEGVIAGINDAYQKRRDHLRAQQELNMEHLKQTLEAEQRMLRAKSDRLVEQLQEERLLNLEQEMIRVARAAQLDVPDVSYETEDEDDVIPRPKRTGYKFKRTGALDNAYDSRSRLALATVRATADMESRFEMHKLLADLNQNERPEDQNTFTLMDPAHREIAVETREGVQNASILADAAAEVERISKIPVIRNVDAVGLQLLGDLASRPSIASSVPPPSRSKPRRGSFAGQSPSRPMPPHLQLQTNYGPSPIPVEMSPRTTQALGDRFDTSMPPPMTPRQATTPFVRSPETMRNEFPIASPTAQTPRMNGFQQSPVRQAQAPSETKSDSFSGHRPVSLDYQHQYRDRRSSANMTPFVVDDRRTNPPLRREHSQELPPPTVRRPSIDNVRPFFGFAGGPPIRDDRGRDEKRESSDSIKNESSPPNQHFRSPLLSWARSSVQAGALDPRLRDPTLAPGEPRRPPLETPRSPHLRDASVSSIHDRSESQTGDNQHRKKADAYKSVFPQKTNKEERGGLPRRAWKEKKKLNLDGASFDKFRLGKSHPFLLGSPVERGLPPAPWQGLAPPQHSPLGPPPPTATYQGPPFIRPSHPPSSQQGFDIYQHRNSFPPPPPQAPASIWNQPSHSALYAVPQQPPPPGVPPEQYDRFMQPPPPGYQHPSTPNTPHPQSAPGSYGPQFGGPPIAPATTNPGYHHPGYRPMHPPPAFAQQAQQQQTNFGNRRRTQSDALAKFHSWTPPNRR